MDVCRLLTSLEAKFGTPPQTWLQNTNMVETWKDYIYIYIYLLVNTWVALQM